MAWPLRDLNHYTFFLWGHMKALVQDLHVNRAEDLVDRIVVAADRINTIPGIFDRVRQPFLSLCEL